MSFHWYLDIEESTYVNQNEIAPPDQDVGPRGTFSVGPIEFEDNETISVMDLVVKINGAFEEAFVEGTSPNRYYMEARVHPISAENFQANVAKINTAKSQRELAIEYRIFNLDNVAFSLQFRSGPHGAVSGHQFGGDVSIPAADVTIINKSDIVGFPTPYCQLEATITDKPPMPPDIVFIPYVGVNNKIMILFNSNAGEMKEYPIVLRNSDISFILDEYFAQHQIALTENDVQELKADNAKKLQYRNDDPIRKYELFRVGAKPTSYNSFRGFSLTEEPIQAELGPDKFSTAPAYVDTIVPNKKYWYCARSIDIHNNVSNPTYIFELEMVDNKGQMFLRQKIIAFEPQKLNYKKTGRRFLAIEPRFEQTFYDEAAESPGTVCLTEEPSSDILGNSEVRQVSSIWGKRFKVRVTSKKTGRKIDLNVTFKNTGVIIP
ncbi:hypothetical protein [uncultured Mediterranean phage]|nr:hypothetical protein [uncultured Mediterranean phage]